MFHGPVLPELLVEFCLESVQHTNGPCAYFLEGVVDQQVVGYIVDDVLQIFADLFHILITVLLELLLDLGESHLAAGDELEVVETCLHYVEGEDGHQLRIGPEVIEVVFNESDFVPGVDFLDQTQLRVHCYRHDN